MSLSPCKQAIAEEFKNVVLHGDVARLRQMMNNLMLYAINASPEGSSVSVETSLVCEEVESKAGGCYVKKVKRFLRLDVKCPPGHSVSVVSAISPAPTSPWLHTV